MIMNKSHLDTDSIKLLGRQMVGLVQRYVRPILCGDQPAIMGQPFIRGGTVTFLKTSKRVFGVTNQHVVEAFRQIRRSRPNFHCQLDSLAFDFEQRLIDQNKRLDLATLDVSEAELHQIGAVPYYPSSWPVEPPIVGELTTIVGYPGQLRYADSPEQLCVPHIGLNIPITSISDTDISFHFEREYWQTDIDTLDPSTLNDFGGMSGSGVFAMRIAPAFVGVLYEYGENFDLLKCSRTEFITQEGMIDNPIY